MEGQIRGYGFYSSLIAHGPVVALYYPFRSHLKFLPQQISLQLFTEAGWFGAQTFKKTSAKLARTVPFFSTE